MPITSPLPHELHISIAEYAAADAILDTNWHWVSELCLLSQVFLPALAPILYHTVFVRASNVDGLCDHSKNPHSWFTLHTRHLVLDSKTFGTESLDDALSSLIKGSPYIKTITGAVNGLIWTQQAHVDIARAVHYDLNIELVGAHPPHTIQETLWQSLDSSSRLTHLHLSISTGSLATYGWTMFTPDSCSITHLLLDIDYIRIAPIFRFITEWLRHRRLKRLLFRPSHKLMEQAVRSRAFNGEGRPARLQPLIDGLVHLCKDMNEKRIWMEGNPQYELEVGRSKMCDVVAGLELWYGGRPLWSSVDEFRRLSI